MVSSLPEGQSGKPIFLAPRFSTSDLTAVKHKTHTPLPVFSASSFARVWRENVAGRWKENDIKIALGGKTTSWETWVCPSLDSLVMCDVENLHFGKSESFWRELRTRHTFDRCVTSAWLQLARENSKSSVEQQPIRGLCKSTSSLWNFSGLMRDRLLSDRRIKRAKLKSCCCLLLCISAWKPLTQ